MSLQNIIMQLDNQIQIPNNGIGQMPIYNRGISLMKMNNQMFNMNINNPNNEINGNIINENNKKAKQNICFDSGKRIYLSIDYGTPIKEMIKIYLEKIGRIDLLNKNDKFSFIYNARKINFDNNMRIEKFFSTTGTPRVIVTFTGDTF